MGGVAQLLANLVARGAVAAVNAAGKMQRLQLRLLSEEPKENVEHFEPFGFTSHPLPGAEHVTLFIDGDRSHGVTVVVSDRRYRLQGLPAGGVALYDASGAFIKLTADGHIRSSGTWVHEGALQVSADIDAGGDIRDRDGEQSMHGMREAYNGHRHGASPLPDQEM